MKRVGLCLVLATSFALTTDAATRVSLEDLQRVLASAQGKWTGM